MLRIYTILFTGIIIASSAAILIRWTGDVPPTVISFYRVFISFCLLLVYQITIPKQKISALKQFHWHYLLAGLFLAAHFITWIASLQLTSIANSVFLVSMHPLFAVILSIIFLKESPNRKSIPVFLIAVFGMFMIVSTDLEKPGIKLTGDILAIISGFCFALYIMIARKHKGEQNFIRYLIFVYGSASLTCIIYILITGDSMVGFTTESWIFMTLLAIGPNLFGHSIFNWASRYLEIFKVNLMLLLETILASFAGILIFAEYPSLNFYIGASLILSSLLFLVLHEKKPQSH